ncbi:hypothetical protein ABFY54_29110 [Priestia megaterium]|uniref:hypothetical protein n=1 Tax=Priestia megaterium TaxID=1404 RepID=UPI003D2D1BE6
MTEQKKTELIKEIKELIEQLKEVDSQMSYVNYDKKLDLEHGVLVTIIEDKIYEIEPYDFDKFVELQELCVNYF